jgi:molecular chaperone DnaK
MEDVLLLDVTPLSLGVETLGGVMTRILDRNTTIPARRSEVFSTAEDNQPAVEIVVLQGEREMAEGNRVLGRFRLEGIQPASAGVPQIEVAFDIDANGILNVSARDKSTGKEQNVTISGSTGLDRKEVDRMLQEAQRHASQDKAAREKVELRNRADQLAYHVDRQIEAMGESLPSHEKGRARELIQRLRSTNNESVSTEELRNLISDLEQMMHMMTATDAQGPRGPQPPADDVVDAEYVAQ